MKNVKTYGFLAALAATILWAGNFVVARAVANDIPPFQLNFSRWLVALLCILPFSLPKLRADWPSICRHWRYLSIIALVGVSALNTFFYKAAQTTESLNMALLVPTAPMMIIILSRIVYGEAITRRRLAGLAVVLTGVLVLISRGDWKRFAAVQFAAGDLWALGGAVCFAVYSLLVRRRPGDISAEGFNAITYALGALFMIPALAWEMAVLPPPVRSFPVLASVLYAGVGCSFAAYLLWTRAITAIGPVRSGFVYYSLPLFAAVGSFMVLGEQITGAHVLGGALIVSGILTATLDVQLPKNVQR